MPEGDDGSMPGEGDCGGFVGAGDVEVRTPRDHRSLFQPSVLKNRLNFRVRNIRHHGLGHAVELEGARIPPKD